MRCFSAYQPWQPKKEMKATALHSGIEDPTLECKSNKEVKDLYTENKKTQEAQEEVKDDREKWEDSPVYRLEGLILLSCQHYPDRSAESV